MNLKTVFKIFLSFFVSAIGIYFATRGVHWQELKTIWSSAQAWPFLLAAAGSILTGILRAWRWQILLNPFRRIRLMQLFRWQIGALFVNSIAPLRLGEFVRAYWTGHKAQIAKSSVLGTIVIERVLDITSIGVIGCIVFISAGIYHLSARQLFIILVIMGAAALTFKFLPKQVFKNIWVKFLNLLPANISALALDFTKGLNAFKSHLDIAKVSFISPVIWALDIGIIAIVSRAVGLNLTWLQAAVLAAGLVLGVMVPAAPGAAGTYEAGGVAAMALLGIGKTLGLSFVLLLHAYQFILTALLGIPILLMEGFSLKLLTQSEKS